MIYKIDHVVRFTNVFLPSLEKLEFSVLSFKQKYSQVIAAGIHHNTKTMTFNPYNPNWELYFTFLLFE